MPQEESEELNTPPAEEPEADIGQPEETPLAEPTDAPPVESPAEPPVEEAPLVEPQAEEVVPKSEYDKLVAERDNYRKGLLAERGQKRKKELFSEPEAAEVPDSPDAVSYIQRDYLSKREDVLADMEEKITLLPDDQFALLQRQLKIEEGLLLEEATRKNRNVAQKHIKDMVQRNLDYLQFRFQPKAPSDELPPQDFGSTRTIRKIQSPKISDEAKRIQAAQKGEKTPLEKIQEMLDRGEI